MPSNTVIEESKHDVFATFWQGGLLAVMIAL